jgi:hypothetical protein
MLDNISMTKNKFFTENKKRLFYSGKKSFSCKSRNIADDLTYYTINKTEKLLITETKIKNNEDIRSSINEIKTNKQNFYKNYHNNVLRSSIRSSSILLRNPQNSYDLERLTMENFNPQMRNTEYNKNFFYKNSLGHISLQEPLSEFKEKTNSLVRMNYALNIQKERKLRLQEEFDNLIEEASDKVKNYKNLKEMFLSDFMGSLEKYMRHIKMQKEAELIKLNQIKDNNHNLKLEVNQLEIRKSKKLKELELCKEYRVFLKSLKSRRSIKVVQKEEEENELKKETQPSNLKIPLSKKGSKNFLFKSRNNSKQNTVVQPKSFSMNLKNILSKKYKINIDSRKQSMFGLFSNLVTGQSIFKDYTKKDSVLENSILEPEALYHNVEEVLDDFKHLEGQVINVINIFNHNKIIIRQLKDDLDLVEVEKYNSKEEHDLINKLKILKEKNKHLNNIMEQKNKENLSSSSPISNKRGENTTELQKNHKIYYKINEIYNNLRHLSICTDAKIIPPDFVPEDNHIKLQILYMLKYIEKGVNFLNLKYSSFESDPKNRILLKSMEKQLEKERKFKIVKQQEALNMERREKLQNDINERYFRVNNVHKRKVARRFRPFKDVRKEAKFYKIQTDADDFEDMISF